jgi:hypothetical protein
MKLFAVAVVVLCFGSLASAANLLINLTGATPTYTTDGGSGSWLIPAAAGTISGSTFTGLYMRPSTSPAETGSTTVFVDSSITGDELYTLLFSYSDAGGGNENYDVGVTKDAGTTKPPTGSDDVLATGSAVGIGFPGGAPGGISVEEIADSPTPEPGTSALIGLGLVALAASRSYMSRKSTK